MELLVIFSVFVSVFVRLLFLQYEKNSVSLCVSENGRPPNISKTSASDATAYTPAGAGCVFTCEVASGIVK